jgi:fatty-acid desaturase
MRDPELSLHGCQAEQSARNFMRPNMIVVYSRGIVLVNTRGGGGGTGCVCSTSCLHNSLCLSCCCCRYVLTGMLGVSMSYHRQLSHKSFRTPKVHAFAESAICSLGFDEVQTPCCLQCCHPCPVKYSCWSTYA